MTWSISRSKVVGGSPIVKWDDTPLRQLGDRPFRDAVRASFALGDDLVRFAGEHPVGRVEMAAEAKTIVKAVLQEMQRRGIDGVPEKEPETGQDNGAMPSPVGEGEAGSASVTSRQPIPTAPEAQSEGEDHG